VKVTVEGITQDNENESDSSDDYEPCAFPLKVSLLLELAELYDCLQTSGNRNL